MIYVNNIKCIIQIYNVKIYSINYFLQDQDEGTSYSTPSYMDPSIFTTKTTVKALYDYKANHVDELSFCKHAIITNVTKSADGWWRGDYGGKKQHFFPANHVKEIDQNDMQEGGDDGVRITYFIFVN